MNQLKITDITAGMLCATDITNKNGQLLIPANTLIEEKHLRLLQAWGFTELPIIANSETKALKTVSPATDNEEIERRFRLNNPTHHAIIEMKRILASGEFLRETV